MTRIQFISAAPDAMRVRRRRGEEIDLGRKDLLGEELDMDAVDMLVAKLRGATVARAGRGSR